MEQKWFLLKRKVDKRQDRYGTLREKIAEKEKKTFSREERED